MTVVSAKRCLVQFITLKFDVHHKDVKRPQTYLAQVFAFCTEKVFVAVIVRVSRLIRTTVMKAGNGLILRHERNVFDKNNM